MTIPRCCITLQFVSFLSVSCDLQPFHVIFKFENRFFLVKRRIVSHLVLSLIPSLIGDLGIIIACTNC